MRKRQRSSLSRGDVIKTVGDRQVELDEKAEDLVSDADDVEVERETLEEVDLSGTREAAEALERSLEAAEEESTQEFEGDEQQLEHVQEAGQEFERELAERVDAVAGDADRIGAARERVANELAARELEQAREEAERDLEFLREQEERAREARENSQRIAEEQRRRLNSSGRS